METEKGFTGPVNLGNPGEFTIRELAEKVINLTGSSSKLIFETLPQDDPLQRQPDISLAKKKLDWEPKINLEQGLKTTVSYFDDYLKAFGVNVSDPTPAQIDWVSINQRRKVS